MKKKSLLSYCCILIFLLVNYPLVSQENWEKYENNPVLTTGDEAMWDEYGVSTGAVLKFDNQFHLWYNGRMSEISNWQIGYAWSDDGINWTKYPFPVITYGTFGNWDNYRRCGSVIRVNDTLKMWFVASKDIPFEMQLGYAWSEDGISWNIHPEPILSVGEDGEWDDYLLFESSVVYTNGQYHMWYGGYDDEEYTPRIGYAISPDGINWEKDMENNPVLEGGIVGSYLEGWVCYPNVMYHDGMFEMWFSGHDVFEHYRIGYASSEDGIEWDYVTEEPVLSIGENETWDDIMVCRPSVIIDDNQYKMWYAGNNGSRYKIGFATGDIVTKTDDNIDKSAFVSYSFPNPFKNTFEIHYALDSKTQIKISLFDSQGSIITTIADDINQAGQHVAYFDGTDLEQGIYYYHISAGELQSKGKIIKIY